MTSKSKSLQGLTNQLKEHLIHQALERRARRIEKQGSPREFDTRFEPESSAARLQPIPERCYRFALHPNYQKLRIVQEGAANLGIPNPYFRLHDGVSGRTTRIADREYLNFSGYNYLGLSGHPQVSAAAKRAIDRYGTSVSASRLVSGERPIHGELERAIADCYGVEDCVVFVSGHATNVSTIGCLFGPKDLIVHDALIHNSALQGIQLSGAKRMSFPHNDAAALESLLTEHRHKFECVLIVIEGLYSMDGDFPELPRFVDIKRRFRSFLMVDDAHSFGVMGPQGMGIRDHFGIDGSDIDIWMGTLSKALASCGGYIAGEKALVEHLKLAAPGFVYSVGMTPSATAAALAALQMLLAEPVRVATLRARGRLFLESAKAERIDTGRSEGYSIIPAVTGSSIRAGRLVQALFERGLNVSPILYPAVEEKAARLRFFVSCEHTESDILQAVAILGEESRRL
jgi:8-amino-7-oxononanoate synthase